MGMDMVKSMEKEIRKKNVVVGVDVVDENEKIEDELMMAYPKGKAQSLMGKGRKGRKVGVAIFIMNRRMTDREYLRVM